MFHFFRVSPPHYFAILYVLLSNNEFLSVYVECCYALGKNLNFKKTMITKVMPSFQENFPNTALQVACPRKPAIPPADRVLITMGSGAQMVT